MIAPFKLFLNIVQPGRISGVRRTASYRPVATTQARGLSAYSMLGRLPPLANREAADADDDARERC